MQDVKPGYKTSEFWLVVFVTLFAAASGSWALYYPEIDLDRLLAINGIVATAAGFWASSRVSVKKAAAAATTRGES